MFIDEAVFTSRLQLTKVWAKYHRKPPVLFKQKLGFAAVAITGAIDKNGKVITAITESYSINVDKFLFFLHELRS